MNPLSLNSISISFALRYCWLFRSPEIDKDLKDDLSREIIVNERIPNPSKVMKIKGVKPMVYNLIKRSNEIQGQYRTYDYLEARKSAVFLEPIRVFTDEN